MNKTSVRQLKQRITFTHKLVPLSQETIHGYLLHRLQVAGYSGQEIFSKKISQRIYKLTNGVPRLINILAHKCLLLAFGEGKACVSSSHLKKAVEDTESLQSSSNGWRWFWISFLGMSASTAALAGYYLMKGIQ